MGGAYYGMCLALAWVDLEAGEAIERPEAERVPWPPQGPMESDIHQQEPTKVS